MINKLKAVSALVIASYATPTLALGIGSIDMHSSMSQPLNASIELYGVERMAATQLIAKLASMQDFERAGVSHDYHLESIKFAVEIDGNGGGVIRLTSEEPIVEPYLNFVLDLRWPDGRILREYTALIDFLPVEQADAIERTTVAARTLPAKVETHSVANKTSDMPSAPTGMIRVENGDSLWRIALKVRPSRDYSPQQTMQALVSINEDAFIRSNINGLQAGSLLRIPSESEIAEISKQQALAWVSDQNRLWDNPEAKPKVAITPSLESQSRPETESNDAYLRLASSDEDSSSIQDEALVTTKPDAVMTGNTENSATQMSVNDELSQRLATTLEDLDKSQRQNDEMAERLSALEEQVRTMQRLMALKDQELASLQGGGASSDDSWMKSPFVLGGVLVAILAALGGFLWRRKQHNENDVVPPVVVPDVQLDKADQITEQKNSDKDQPNDDHQTDKQAFAAEVVQELAKSEESITESSQEHAEQEEVEESMLDDVTALEEAIVEIDIYVAYGRAPAALDLAKKLANEHPDNDIARLKVMEVAAIVGDISDLYNVRADLDATTDPSTKTAWAALQAEYSILSVDNVETVEVSNDAQVQNHEDNLGWDVGLDEVSDESVGSEKLEHDLADLDGSDDVDQSGLENFEENAALDDQNMDVDDQVLDSSDFEENSNELNVTPENIADELPDLDFDSLSEDLALPDDESFDLDESDLDLGDIGLPVDDDSHDDQDLASLVEDISIDDGDDASLDDIITDSLPKEDVEDLEDWLTDGDEVATKLDLARAYVEMGDAEGARDILEEILLDGNEEQKSEALALKEQLP